MTKCEACGKETANPRFCNRSCAARKNNSAFPKRKPGGECAKCRTAITSRKKYCQGCQSVVTAEKEEQKRRREQNYRSWLTPAGEKRDGPVKKMRVKTIFTAETWPREKLSAKSSTHDLLDHLIGICCADTPYLRKQDAMRYVSLLNELRETEFQDWSHGAETKTTVDRTSIERLPEALRGWVYDYFNIGNHPMMPAYAMDAARFIELHVRGFDTGEWSIDALVPTHDTVWNEVLFDRAFRKCFSTKFGPLVSCKVPDTGYTISPAYYVEQLKPGSRFLFRIHRCHLSESSRCFEIVCDDAEIRHDLMSEFCFTGEIILHRTRDGNWGPVAPDRCAVSLPEITFDLRTASASVSGRWITHALARSNGEGYLQPVPRWSPDGTGAVSPNIQ